ncbi:MAG: TonB-dependent receptor [Acidobacteriaceae bacterium]
MRFSVGRTWLGMGWSPYAKLIRGVSFLAVLVLFATRAQAVVVRGHVTDALGRPVPGALMRLVQDHKVVAMDYADSTGAFEIRYAEAGRFTLVGSAGGYLPAVGTEIYGGATDVVKRDVVLSTNTVKQDVTVSATGIPTPLPQLTSPVSVIPADSFSKQPDLIDAMRQEPGVFMVQTGQMGGETSLFLRGGSSTANLVMMDGTPADDIGGTFDFGTVSSAALSNVTVVRGPDSAMYGTDAGAGVVTLSTPKGTTAEPLLDYEGDAGNLWTYRNQVALSGVLQGLDYYTAFSRIDTSNDLPLDEYHNETDAANIGYNFAGNTQLRFTLHNADSVQGVPGAWDFQGVAQSNRQADQDLYSSMTVENWYKGKWHNLVRYDIARKREQEKEFAAGGTFLANDPGAYGPDIAGPGNVGNVVTIRGANGYTATGQVQLYTGNNYDQDSNLDEVYYQTDYNFSPHMIGLFGFRYDDERGSFNDYDPSFDYVEHESLQRPNYEYNLQFQGEFWHRLFYSAGGAVVKNHLFGIAGTPRIGLTYIPVRPGGGLFHGTRLRANVATGVQEPTLAVQFESLYTQLLEAGDTTDIALYHITPQGAEDSRTYDVGMDQNIFGEKLVLKVGYYHNMFNNQLEGVDAQALNQYFHLNINPNVGLSEAYMNSLAYSAQGAEVALIWQPQPHFLFRAGYTYLDARVLQSFSSDAVAALQGTPTENPNLPGIAIGALSPLVGARPFRRAPNFGYFSVEYTHRRLIFSLDGAAASRSDDSTFLQNEDLNGGNTLLLPNRNLDFGYVKLDMNVNYQLKRGFFYFAQFDNLLNDQHIGPIGYPALPLTFRTGLELRLGGKQ